MSGAAYDQVAGKVEAAFTDAGEHELKNIAKPVRIWRWSDGDAAPADEAAPLQLPDKPSIAVLPFVNMSGDPEQEYFSDGISEDMITELSRFRSMIVVARNSSFHYKGQSPKIQDVGRELGVQYVVEGSVRKAGNRVRVTAQLLDASTGNHLWAERYDRNLEDIFDVQDEVVRQIAAAIPGLLDRLAVEDMRRKPPNNLSAYDYELRGRWAYLHLAEGLPVALEWYEKAVGADPDYAQAHAGLGMVYAFGAIGLGLEPEAALNRGKKHVQRAISLDERNPTINIYAAFTYHVSGEHRLARKHAERAVSLNQMTPCRITSRLVPCAIPGIRKKLWTGSQNPSASTHTLRTISA